MPVYLQSGKVLLDDDKVAFSPECCCCPCQPVHASISWQADDSGDPGVGEPEFHETFTAEVDIPPLSPLNNCIFGYSDPRLFVTITNCPFPVIVDPTGIFELNLHYDTGLALWVTSFDIIITPGVIKCGGFVPWPVFGCGVSIDGNLGTRTFSCPPADFDEPLTDLSLRCPNFTGHATVSFT